MSVVKEVSKNCMQCEIPYYLAESSFYGNSLLFKVSVKIVLRHNLLIVFVEYIEP